MPKPSREERIRAELNRLNRYFRGVDENQRANASQLMQNAAFMVVTLQDLQEIINNEGTTTDYSNGQDLYGERPSACLQAYIIILKNYAGIVNELSRLLPVADDTEDACRRFNYGTPLRDPEPPGGKKKQKRSCFLSGPTPPYA